MSFFIGICTGLLVPFVPVAILLSWGVQIRRAHSMYLEKEDVVYLRGMSLSFVIMFGLSIIWFAYLVHLGRVMRYSILGIVWFATSNPLWSLLSVTGVAMTLSLWLRQKNFTMFFSLVGIGLTSLTFLFTVLQDPETLFSFYRIYRLFAVPNILLGGMLIILIFAAHSKKRFQLSLIIIIVSAILSIISYIYISSIQYSFIN